MEKIPILRMGKFLLVTIQVDMHDRLALQLQEDLTNRIVAARAHGDDAVGEVVLQLQRQPVVHVHLDRHQEELAHPQDRYFFHRRAVRPTCLAALWPAYAAGRS